MLTEPVVPCGDHVKPVAPAAVMVAVLPAQTVLVLLETPTAIGVVDTEIVFTTEADADEQPATEPITV